MACLRSDMIWRENVCGGREGGGARETSQEAIVLVQLTADGCLSWGRLERWGEALEVNLGIR